MKCSTCQSRFLCEGDECNYKHDPWPEETEERFKEWQEEQAEVAEQVS